jgi:hypothetical protein
VQQQSVPKSVVPQPVKVPQQQPVTHSQLIMNDALALEKHVFQNPTAPIEQSHRFEVDLNDVQDWQRAFVHSEIFSRKY